MIGEKVELLHLIVEAEGQVDTGDHCHGGHIQFSNQRAAPTDATRQLQVFGGPDRKA